MLRGVGLFFWGLMLTFVDIPKMLMNIDTGSIGAMVEHGTLYFLF